VITGFNTDIEHEGVVYHVQTEDKGLDTPIILSLVYVGGAILASKRAPYEDLIAEGFSDEVLAERLKRQHRLICAAINSGRINDLKKMSPRAEEAPHAAPEPPVVETEVPEVVPEIVREPEPEQILEEPVVATPAETGTVEPVEPSPEVVAPFDLELEEIPSQIWAPPPKEEPVAASEAEETPKQPEYAEVADTGGVINLGDVSGEGLQILLLNDAEFNSGEVRTLRVLVVNRSGAQEEPLHNISVSIKVLGTTFRPLIYSLKTDREGVASVTTQIPQFTSGRAAVLVRAVAKDEAAELRRVIHPIS
jgi:hypothetical protein